MKKILLINGSPRKSGNTATLLEKACQGAREAGAQVEMIHLYDYKFTGCVSCFACKSIKDPFLGRCAIQDELAPILEKAMKSDAIIFGSPIYLFNISSAMRAFLERLVFMNSSYDYESPEHYSIFPGKINIGFFYTMNITEEEMKIFKFDQQLQSIDFFLHFFNGQVETLIANDTYQFHDYSKYHAKAINLVRKEKSRTHQFPKNLERAYQIGKQFA